MSLNVECWCSLQCTFSVLAFLTVREGHEVASLHAEPDQAILFTLRFDVSVVSVLLRNRSCLFVLD